MKDVDVIHIICITYYRPQTKFAKFMFLHVSVILSTVRVGGLPQCMLGYHTPQDQAAPPGPGTPWEQTPRGQTPLDQAPPWDQTPPWTRPSQTRHPPGTRPLPLRNQCILGDTVNKRAVCIVLECNLVFSAIDSAWQRIFN